ncbi:hypothetical protein [Pectinatus frisingensis]|uniref:hypothetical protein n=1 Tax=Pectinatus frisingensis TaxID=865 RepID=UPI0018C6B606|nr:hypothetical protein [Pectinatus frisingensis]
MKRILVLVILLCIIGTTCFAEKNPNDITKNFNYLGFDPITFNEDRIDMTILGPVFGVYPDSRYQKNKIDGYYITRKDLFGSASFFMTLTGLNLSIKNKTDDAIIVHWNQSVFSLNNFKGIPWIYNMKFSNAGNPAYTPDTIIPPNSSSEVLIASNQIDTSFGYPIFIGPIVGKNTSISESLYMCTSDTSGNLKFYNFIAPNVELKDRPMHNGRLSDTSEWLVDMLNKMKSEQAFK